MTERNNGSGQQALPAASSSTGDAGVDIEKLVEKVYQLMCDDARLDRARGKTPRRGTRDIRR